MSTYRPDAAISGIASKLVFRQVAFTLAAFDRLKDHQRYIERTEGRTLTNGEVLDRLILANPKP